MTGPLFLLIALFSVLGRVPVFAGSDMAWGDWSHLILVAWLGSTAAFAAQWLGTRRRSDLVVTARLLAGSLLDYVF